MNDVIRWARNIVCVALAASTGACELAFRYDTDAGTHDADAGTSLARGARTDAGADGVSFGTDADGGSLGADAATDAPPATGASLRGDMGGVQGFDVQNAMVSLIDADHFARIDAIGPQGWAMASMHLTDPLTSSTWAPGTSHEWDPALGDSTYGTGLGCSGPSYENWNFDTQADHIAVHVDAGATPNSRVVTFALYWDARGSQPAQAVSGSFEVTTP